MRIRGAAAALLAAFIVVSVPASAGDGGLLVRRSGAVWWERDGVTSRVGMSALVPPGAAAVTGPNSRARLMLGAARLELGERARVVLGAGGVVAFERGALRFELAPDETVRVEIATARGRIDLRGGSGLVAIDRAQTIVACERCGAGDVAVVGRDGARTALTSGQALALDGGLLRARSERRAAGPYVALGVDRLAAALTEP